MFSGETGQELTGFFAYDPAVTSGVQVAVGDVTGDGRADIVTAPGAGGGPHVKVFDGVTLAEVRGFLAFDAGHRGGVSVAVGDVDGDGVAEIVAGMLGGGSEVRVFARSGDAAVSAFTAYAPDFAGGTWVATTDADGDGRAEIVTGVGRGGGTHVRVLDGTSGAERLGFFAYEPEFRGGVLVGGGDIDGDGAGDILTGPGLGGGPRVRAFSGRDGSPLNVAVGDFFSYAPDFRGGCFVAAADLDADGKADLVTGAGPGGSAHVRAVRATDGQELASFIAYDPVALGGGFARQGGQVTPTAFALAEGDRFLTETGKLVRISPVSPGTQTLSFDLAPVFDRTAAGVEDVLNVFLVDARDRANTLVDRGVEGTPLVSISGDSVQLAVEAGVRYDGGTVSVDVTNVSAPDGALLVYQLINLDGDTGTRVTASTPQLTTDPDGVVGPVFPAGELVAGSPSGPLATIDQLAEAAGVRTELSNARFDPATGLLTADLVVVNAGAEAVGRNVVARFRGLPATVALDNPSGVDAAGVPYLSLRDAAPVGGLGAGERTRPVAVRLRNPGQGRFPLTVAVAAGPNTPPAFGEPDAALTTRPGEVLRWRVPVSDADADPLTLSATVVRKSDGEEPRFPVFSYDAAGNFRVVAQPDQVGEYQLALTLSDGASRVTRDLTLEVRADPDQRTRVSGAVLNTDDQPLAGVRVEVVRGETTLAAGQTAADGTFVVPVPATVTAEELNTATLRVYGNELTAPAAYHFVEMPLGKSMGFLGRDPFLAANNQIPNRVYLQALDTANAAVIVPNGKTTVRSAVSGLRLEIPADSLYDRITDKLYRGRVSLSVVADQKTPIPLAPEFLPEYAYTVQPVQPAGSPLVVLEFRDPAEIIQPYSGPLPVGTKFDLIGFDSAGVMKSLGKAEVVDETDAATPDNPNPQPQRRIRSATPPPGGPRTGLRTGSCDFYVPEKLPVDTSGNPGNQDNSCHSAAATTKTNSAVELHGGELHEEHALATYQSLGAASGVVLRYDSLRADPRPVVNFGSAGFTAVSDRAVADTRLVARMEVRRGADSARVDGAARSPLNPAGGEHFWRVAAGQTSYQAALQADLRSRPTGRYEYTVDAGLLVAVAGRLRGRTSQLTGTFVSVNSIDSVFGSGWGVAGLQHLVVEPDQSVLLVDGDGTQLLFPWDAAAGRHTAPPGDFSTLAKAADGGYTRTLPDQTVYTFGPTLDLETVRDRNGNTTTHRYRAAGQIAEIEDPVGLKTTFTYGPDGKVSAVTNPDGRRTELTYDAVGNLRTVTDPDAAARTWSYDADHRMTSELDARGNRETTTYNFAGRAVEARMKDGTVKRVSPLQTRALYSPERTTRFDAAPPVQTYTTAEAFVADANGNVESHTLDRAGQTVSSRDWRGSNASVVRGDKNLVSRSNDARGNATAFYYDARGNPTEVIDNLAVTSPTRRDSVGREFWLSFQKNDGSSTPELFISGYAATTGVVEIPGLGYRKPFAVKPGETTHIDDIPREVILAASDGVADLGIRVTAERPVTVTGVNRQAEATDGFLALPVDVLGTDYVVAGYKNTDDQRGRQARGSYFAVVATADQTQLTVVPAAGSVVKPAGVPYTVTLDRGQTSFLSDDSRRGADLAGTTITATSPVAVFGGHKCAFVPDGFLACNHLVEQLVPTSSWGDTFVVTPTYRQVTAGGRTQQVKNDLIRVFAAQDGTDVFVAGAKVATLARGAFHEQSVTDTVTVTSSRPALVAQFAVGATGLTPDAPSNDLGDPFMLLVPPVSQFIEIQTTVVPNGFADNYLSVVIPTSAINSLTLNGLSRGADAFSENFEVVQDFAAVGRGLSAAIIKNTNRLSLTIAAKEGFGLTVYGFSAFDNYGFLGGQSFEPFNRRTMTYDATFSQMTGMTDELGRRTVHDIDPANGNLRSATRVMGLPDGAAGDTQTDLVTAYTYNARGQVLTTTDPLGRVTENGYDPLGRLVRVTAARGTADETTSRYEYFDTPAGLSGNVKAMTDGRGNRTEYAYDAMNRVVKVTDADPDGPDPQASPVTEMAYDPNGNLVRTTDPLGSVTSYAYDAMNRRVATTAPDPDGPGPLAAPVTRTSYEPNGNLRAVTDPNANVTQYRYDERLRRTATIDPDGGVTRFAYDLDDNLVSLRDPGGNLTRFGYDYRGRQVSETDPLGKTTVYAFDPANRLAATVDRLGRRTEFAYDDADRLTREAWVGGGNAVEYSYDRAGNLVGVRDAFSVLAFAPDALNRTAAVDNAGTPGSPRVRIEYEYDDAGNVVAAADRIAGAEGATVRATYDALNRPTAMTQGGPGVAPKRVEMGYNALGQTTAVRRFGALAGGSAVAATAFGYDAMHRLTDIDHGAAQRFTYTYDAGSRITAIASRQDVVSYAYDRRDELTGADYRGDTLADESYRYDANGNRLQSSRHGSGYATDPNTANRLRTDGTYTYEYDANGNQTVRTTVADGTVRTQEWDYRNRLVKVTDKSAGGVLLGEVSFVYDALNRRIGKSAGGVATWFVYDREDVALEFRGADLAVRYFHGPGVDQVLAEERPGGAVQWLLTDHLGSTRAVVSGGGAVQLVSYDSYGNPTGALPTRYGFTGRDYDSETGLWYYRARYYDAAAGRFVGEDLVRANQLANNLYLYVDNLPTILVDPFGDTPREPRGPRNIGAENFGVRDIDSVEKLKEKIREAEQAFEAAKKANDARERAQTLRRLKTLRGLLKVIKRGGLPGLVCGYVVEQVLEEAIKQLESGSLTEQELVDLGRV